MISFMDGINISTGYNRWDKLLPGIVVAVLSCAKDISFLSKFSAIGLIALALSFGVISAEGIKENGWVDLNELLTLNLWPESLSAASSWFGVVVFGYGVVPVIFNVRESMANPQFISISTSVGLGTAYVGYLFASNGVRILFSKSHSFDGDVLQALPNSEIALAVRLMMTFVVTVTAPFIVVPVSLYMLVVLYFCLTFSYSVFLFDPVW
jgi:amino acid permease